MTDKNDVIAPLAQPVMARRTTLRTLALGGLAAFAGTAASMPAAEAQVCPWPNGSLQEGWRWCSKCQGMFYALASAGKGICPADHQPHTDAGSGHYYERIGTDIANVQQGGWCWCSKCAGFFYGRASAGAGGMGICPRDGLPHTKSGSGAYAAVLGETATGQQGGWRWCQKCMGMWYASATTNPKGVCPRDANGHTQAGSGHYASLD